MTQKKESRLARIAAAILAFTSFAIMVWVNALANALPLNGVNTGQLSDEIPNLFVPTGLTFSIWGLIYLLLCLFAFIVLTQALSKKPFSGAWEPLDSLIFSLNALANAAWIFAWHWRLLPLSLALMLVILGSLIFLAERMYRRLSPGGALHQAASPRAPAIIRRGLSLPIHVYLGWICVATIANVTALLVSLGWTGWGIDPQIWTIIAIVAGLAVALGLALRRRAIAAPLVVVWAYAGIIIKRLPQSQTEGQAIVIAAAAAIGIILAAILLGVLRMKKRS